MRSMRPRNSNAPLAARALTTSPSDPHLPSATDNFYELKLPTEPCKLPL